MIGFGGREYAVTNHSVLQGQARWTSFNGRIPSNAVDGGQEADGRTLYVCRVRHDGMVYAGKYRSGFRGCNYSDRGTEYSFDRFDILTQ
ncbi:DM9 repeat-containing protein [Faunimonas sp. B44]|uniref:DM9 repeat-containing protein n=1 Tax=Faunimonas sp. B44 TaxID=3461493 RepID=UPI0040444BA5